MLDEAAHIEGMPYLRRGLSVELRPIDPQPVTPIKIRRLEADRRNGITKAISLP